MSTLPNAKLEFILTLPLKQIHIQHKLPTIIMIPYFILFVEIMVELIDGKPSLNLLMWKMIVHFQEGLNLNPKSCVYN